MSTHIRFNDDVEEDYRPSDSEDDYSENEKELLSKVRRGRQESESDDEVYAVGAQSDSDDNRSDLALSDVEGQEDDDLPDIRAWGKDKRKYYATDYVDPDYGGFQGKDAQLAELEEEEARKLQQQLAQQLDDDDFSLDLLKKNLDKEEKKSVVEDIVKTDISKLSKRQKLEILEKESPEFFGLVEDFKAKMLTAKDFLKPTIVLSKDNKVLECSAMDFVRSYYELILNYCTNIYAYLLLKASRVNVQKHPVMKRLYQYRQLLLKLEPIFEETIKPQIEVLLQESTKTIEENKREEPKRKTLKVLKKAMSGQNVADSDDKKRKKIKLKEPEKVPLLKTDEIDDDDDDNDDDEKVQEKVVEDDNVDENSEREQNVDETGNEKREITYQMAKNKGLTPHRKKEQRNPRVKHRNKYRKAKIRRKGAVREVRKELSRYGGEISGIKASVVKSIKLKS